MITIKKICVFLLLSVFAICFSAYANSSDVDSRVQKLKEKLITLQQRYTDRHPDVRALKRKITKLEEQLKHERNTHAVVADDVQHSQEVPPDIVPSATKKKTDKSIQKKRKQLSRTNESLRIKKEPQKNRGRGSTPPIRLYSPEGSLRLPIKVKETAGVGAKTYPITVGVPVPFGKYQTTDKFRLIDISGKKIPAQFDVLNRWWCRDNSIRHLKISFQPTVAAFRAKETGIATYYLCDDGPGAKMKTPLEVTETRDRITVVTGSVKFTVNKKNFTILDEVWLDQDNSITFEDSEKIVQSNSQNGGNLTGRLAGDLQIDSSRKDIDFVIEESGPLRVVIRAEAVTKYYNTKKHIHGYAVRIYAYAGKSYIKIDYQLQNSAKNKVFAWPLYFEAMNIDLRTDLADNPRVRIGLGDGTVYERKREKGLYLAQEFHDKCNIYDLSANTVLASGKMSDGFMDISDSQKGVTAIIRHFWQMWPNGLEINTQNKLSLQLFPKWSAQWQQKTNKATPRFSSTGLYWLEDMQHVYKETLLFFHGPEVSNSDLSHLARTFQYPPVATLPTRWYKETCATLDMGGLIPIDERVTNSDERIYSYSKWDFNYKKSTHYKFNWDNFYIDKIRKWTPAQGGRWPYTVSAFIATENPKDYFYAEQFAIGELNVRPQWMAQYVFEKDWKFLQLTENPYSGVSWRKIKGGNYNRHFDAPFLEGTTIDAKPRDDEHGWFYHVEEAYYFTCNPWIKDWYKFVAEFRKTRLHHLDPFTDNTTRATAHSLAHALQAYRITGDTSLIQGFRGYINNWLRPAQNPVNGGIKKRWDRASWVGYLSRAIISFMEEVRGKDWQAYSEAFNFLSGLMEWNYIYGQFGYQVNANKGQIGSSSGTSQNLADPQAWYFLHTGKTKYLEHLNQYIDKGINGGEKPRKVIKKWKDQFQGRYVQFVRENKKEDLTPPKAIVDFEAMIVGSDMRLTWTAPKDAVRYHIVWSNKPISEETITDPAFTNWWAANPIGPHLHPVPGQKQSLTITPPSTVPFYAAIFTFDENDNMSSISNVARATPE